jgi:hypothetical protein
LVVASALLALCAVDCRSDPTRGLSPDELRSLEAFTLEVRSAYEEGDASAVEKLIATDGLPPNMLNVLRHTVLPKGPTRVTDVRIESADGWMISPHPVDYRYNLDVVAKLVLEVDDVSVGPTTVEMVVGRANGSYRIAGIRPVD